MSRGGASAEDDAGWDAIGEKDGAIGYEAVLTDQRRQRRRIEHGAVEGRNGCVRRGMVGILDISPILLHTYMYMAPPRSLSQNSRSFHVQAAQVCYYPPL